jgi:hypothetical protein
MASVELATPDMHLPRSGPLLLKFTVFSFCFKTIKNSRLFHIDCDVNRFDTQHDSVDVGLDHHKATQKNACLPVNDTGSTWLL